MTASRLFSSGDGEARKMAGDIKVEISLRHQSNSLLCTPTSGPSQPPSLPTPPSTPLAVTHSLTLIRAEQPVEGKKRK